MSVKEILLLGNPLLRKYTEPVSISGMKEINHVVDDLRDTLNKFRSDNGFGRGIAAPQIGISLKIIFIQFDKQITLINPEIISASSELVTLWDDCFSIPNLMIKVKRHKEIKVRYHDMEGAEYQISAADELSELLQHEIDHLDGVLAIDRAIDSKHIILRSEWEKFYSDRKTSSYKF